MSYPGQPGPYGQQPDPYWQQGGQPGWGPPPPPPPRSNAGLWVSVTIAVVLVAALGVTGFAWPGFFLASDDKPANSASDGKPANGGSCEEPDDSEDPEPVAKALASCIGTKDSDGLRKFACEDASKEVTRMVDTVDRVDRAKLLKTSKVSDDEARADIEVAVGGKAQSFQAVLAKSDDTWCWKRNDAAGAGGPRTSARSKPSGRPSSRQSGSPESKIGPPSGEGGAVLEEFLGAINDKNGARADELICEQIGESDSKATHEEVDKAVAGREPKLTVADDATSTEGFVTVGLDGTFDGKRVSGIISAHKEDERWCISTFSPWYY